MGDALYALGRVALVVVFLVSGYNLLTNIDASTAQLNSLVLSRLPPIPVSAQLITIGVGVVEVLAAVLIIFGYWTRFAAFLLLVGTIGYVIFVNEVFSLQDVTKLAKESHLLTLSLIGGLLMVLAMGPGRLSADWRAPPPPM